MSQTPPPPPPPPGSYGGAPPPPPGSPAGTRPGELLDRFLARLIDGVGFAVVVGILSVVFTAMFYRGFTNSLGEVFLFNLFLQVFSVAIYLGYYGWFESTKGATFGKQIMKLTVVGPDGHSHPTLQQAVMRSGFQALSLISIVPIIGAFLGPLASLAAVVFIAVTISNDDRRRQGWHDTFAGGTQVLKVG